MFEISLMRLMVRTSRYRLAVYPDTTAVMYTTDPALAAAARQDAEKIEDLDGLYVIKLKKEAVAKYLP
ncbi:hypothetical protein [Pyrobaculum sp.]|uniref:hypothetical protein n=1 Tax=Pyrobaculum sp. TaxID=2004705 RepID=UPI003D12C938